MRLAGGQMDTYCPFERFMPLGMGLPSATTSDLYGPISPGNPALPDYDHFSNLFCAFGPGSWAHFTPLAVDQS